MNLHNPDLDFFLCLLTGFAAFLAIEYIRKFCRRKPPVLLPLDGLQRDRPARPTEGRTRERPSDFSRLSESVKLLIGWLWVRTPIRRTWVPLLFFLGLMAIIIGASELVGTDGITALIYILSGAAK
jgi:hypothetical protein